MRSSFISATSFRISWLEDRDAGVDSLRAEGARNKGDLAGESVRWKGGEGRVSAVNVFMGDSRAAVDLVRALESGSFFNTGSGKTLTTEYTGTVIMDEVTDEVVADIADPREV